MAAATGMATTAGVTSATSTAAAMLGKSRRRGEPEAQCNDRDRHYGFHT
jgi:hypothetical protein